MSIPSLYTRFTNNLNKKNEKTLFNYAFCTDKHSSNSTGFKKH